METQGVACEQLLSVPTLRNAIVLAGHRGLSNRVTRVNVMEVPDVIPWVRAGEFLMTTGYPFRDNPAVLVQLIPQLAERRVVAMGIKTHRFIDEVPKDVFSIADELAFPLIELPPETSFSDVVRDLMERIIGGEVDYVTRMQSRIQVVAKALLRQVSTSEILEVAEETLGHPLALIYERQAACSSREPDLIRFAHEALVRAIPEGRLKDDCAAIVQGPNRAYRVYSVHAGEFEGRALQLVAIENGLPMDALDTFTLEHMAPLIGLEWINRMARQKVQLIHQDGFLRDWLGGILVDPLDIANRAKATGILSLSQGPYCVMIAQTTNHALAPAALVDFLERIRCSLAPYQVLVTLLEQQIVFVALEHRDGLEETCTDVLQHASQSLPVDTHLCVGRTASALTEVARSYREARRVADVRHIVRPQDPIAHFSELGIFRILSLVPMLTETMEFVREWIQPLRDYDAVNHTALIDTLRVYFETNGNVKESARQLFTHHNTISYRLARIQDILQVDLAKADPWLQINIALKLSEFMRTAGDTRP